MSATLTWLLFDEQGRLIRSWPATGDGMSPKQGERMTINNFAIRVSKQEGKKKQLSIAQISEVLKVVNALLGGQLYKEIKKL
jgi:hypothetical protein